MHEIKRYSALWLHAGILTFITAAAYFAVGAASLVPKALRPTSGVLPGPAEHYAAYFVLGLISTHALRGRMSVKWLACLNCAYAGFLELGQLAVPGRVSTPIDFLASTAGSCCGIAVMCLLLHWTGETSRDHPADSEFAS